MSRHVGWLLVAALVVLGGALWPGWCFRHMTAAEHLRAGNLEEPVKGLDGADQPLLELLAELVVEAGRESTHPAMLEVQRQQLELARIERQIQAARAQGAGDVSDLAHRRTKVKQAFDRAQERALEHTSG